MESLGLNLMNKDASNTMLWDLYVVPCLILRQPRDIGSIFIIAKMYSTFITCLAVCLVLYTLGGISSSQLCERDTIIILFLQTRKLMLRGQHKPASIEQVFVSRQPGLYPKTVPFF